MKILKQGNDYKFDLKYSMIKAEFNWSVEV